jgi:hypothetical protein
MTDGRVPFPSEHQQRLTWWLAVLPEALGWWERVTLDSLKFARNDGYWLLVIQARRRGEHVVAFVAGDDMYGCLNNLAHLIRASQMSWSTDKYPPGVAG